MKTIFLIVLLSVPSLVSASVGNCNNFDKNDIDSLIDCVQSIEARVLLLEEEADKRKLESINIDKVIQSVVESETELEPANTEKVIQSVEESETKEHKKTTLKDLERVLLQMLEDDVEDLEIRINGLKKSVFLKILI